MKTTTIILLIVLNIILIIKFEYIKKQFNKQQNNESWEKNEIAYATFKSYIYEYQKVYINNIQENSLDTLINSKYKLFFKIPISYCDACIRPMLKELKSIIPKTDKRKIIIITSFTTQKEVQDFINKMEIHDLVILNMPDNDFTLNTKELIGAYLFLLNNDLIAKKVFFCSKFNTYCYSSYLMAITQYLE